jgi:DNA modification methylase
LYTGAADRVLPHFERGTVQSVVTSPPYFNVRDYGDDRQIGNESSVNDYINALVSVFRKVGRVLDPSGAVWVNLSDTYAGTTNRATITHGGRGHATGILPHRIDTTSTAPRKSLLGIPWRFALAMQAEGWIIRNEVIWHKPNGTPESVRDRLTRRHETLFLFTRTQQSFFDLDSIRDGRGSSPGDVWKISTRPSKTGHFAMFPKDIPDRCLRATSRPGDLILDPFSGMATTGVSALTLGRRYAGIDVNDDYNASAHDRLCEVWRERVDPAQKPLFPV